VQILPTDTAFLQYTGGTTGVSKGAVLSHQNILANVLQVDVWLEPALTLKTPAGIKVGKDDQLVFLCALPLYHIFALTACALVGIQRGALNILVPNPKDIAGFIQLLAKNPSIHLFPVVNTLLAALLRHPNFAKLQFPNLLVTIGGGMAVQKTIADLYFKVAEGVITRQEVFKVLHPHHQEIIKKPEKITKKTKAIMAVHLYGRCVEMNKINEISRTIAHPLRGDGIRTEEALIKFGQHMREKIEQKRSEMLFKEIAECRFRPQIAKYTERILSRQQ
jgi:acyl-CoA synthetase (AMP-forming)/AMP-acid ligase II